MDRYNRVVRHHIVCTLCNSQELGREYHYLFNYSYCLSEIRQYVNQHVYRYPNILNLCVCVRTRVCVHVRVRVCVCIWCFLLRSTFAGSVWSLDFHIHATTANYLRLRRIFIPDVIYLFVVLS